MAKLTVFYNGRCPVCDGGIRWERNRLEPIMKSVIDWVDINSEPGRLLHHGVDLDEVRKKLHAEDDQGKLYVGVKAFAAMWRLIPSMQWAGAFISIPVISFISALIYDVFAEILYKWNRYRGRW